MSLHRRELLTALGATATAALAGCAGVLPDDSDETDGSNGSDEADGTERPTEAPFESTPEPSPDSVDLESELASQGSGESELVKVVGTATNVGDGAVERLAVTAAFYDETGAVLAERGQSVTDLESGRTWRFELYFPGTGEDARAVADHSLTASVDGDA